MSISKGRHEGRDRTPAMEEARPILWGGTTSPLPMDCWPSHHPPQERERLWPMACEADRAEGA